MTLENKFIESFAQVDNAEIVLGKTGEFYFVNVFFDEKGIIASAYTSLEELKKGLVECTYHKKEYYDLQTNTKII